MNHDGHVDDDCFYYHSWRNNVVIAFGTLSSLSKGQCELGWELFSDRCIDAVLGPKSVV